MENSLTRALQEKGIKGEASLLVLFCFCAFLLFPARVWSQVDPSPETQLPVDLKVRLQAQLSSGSVDARRSALAEIRNLRSPDASRLALAALKDKEAVVRATAAASVIFAPKNEASSALLPLLNDKLEFVRREAAYALGDVQDSAATPQLIRLLQNDKIFEVRTAAAISLGKIGDTSALESLMAILKTRPRENEEFLRRSAARSIGQIAQISVTGNPSVLTPQNFLPEKFKDLGTSDPTGPSPLSFSAAAEILTVVLKNDNESDDTRREAAFSLGAVGDKRSIPVLQTYLAAADPYLAEICKEALLKIERRNKIPGPTD